MLIALLLACSGRSEPTTSPVVLAARERAQERMAQDRLNHSSAELAEVEELYQVANTNYGEVAAVAALEKLLREYSDFNRTGCAVLYLGQMSSGPERQEYLSRAMEQHADAYYGDGVNVGTYAAFQLGLDLHAAGDHQGEAELFAGIGPEHVDHKGRVLVELIADIQH